MGVCTIGADEGPSGAGLPELVTEEALLRAVMADPLVYPPLDLLIRLFAEAQSHYHSIQLELATSKFTATRRRIIKYNKNYDRLSYIFFKKEKEKARKENTKIQLTMGFFV